MHKIKSVNKLTAIIVRTHNRQFSLLIKSDEVIIIYCVFVITIQ